MGAKSLQGTPAWLGAVNDRTAYALLLEHGVLTRNRIGELSGLSKPTASQIVSRLEGAGLIHVVGEVSGGRGPNAAGYAARTDLVYGVAVDVT
ncbi:MAG TPA: helix-turn-helix domain-containing protein, partial [Agromyces sp.]